MLLKYASNLTELDSVREQMNIESLGLKMTDFLSKKTVTQEE
jgi:hypothetical protein